MAFDRAWLTLFHRRFNLGSTFRFEFTASLSVPLDWNFQLIYCPERGSCIKSATPIAFPSIFKRWGALSAQAGGGIVASDSARPHLFLSSAVHADSGILSDGV